MKSHNTSNMPTGLKYLWTWRDKSMAMRHIDIDMATVCDRGCSKLKFWAARSDITANETTIGTMAPVRLPDLTKQRMNLVERDNIPSPPVITNNEKMAAPAYS